MTRYLKWILLILAFSGLSFCNSTDSGETKLDKLLSNSTWYFIANDIPADSPLSDQYKIHEYGDLNTSVTYSYHKFPCGSQSNSTETYNYSVINNSEIVVDDDTVEVEGFSESNISLRFSEDGVSFTGNLRKSCQDLPN